MGQAGLQQRRDDLRFQEQQRQFGVTSSMRQKELDELIAYRNKRLSMEQEQMQQQYGLQQKQFGLAQYQAGFPGYTEYLGGEQQQYRLPGIPGQTQPFTLFGGLAARAAMQYNQPSQGGGGGGYGGYGGEGGFAPPSGMINPQQALGPAHQAYNAYRNQMQQQARQQRINLLWRS
jgi:hypothetical protein